MGQDYGSTKTQNARVMRYVPPGRDLWKADETKACVSLM